MKRTIAYLLLLAGLATFACACDDGNDPPAPSEPVARPEPIGAYTFAGDDYDILYAAAAEDEYDFYFVFSPLEGESTLTTYAAVGLKRAFEGIEQDVTRIFHNDDYTFIYEDPVHLYSQYRQLRSGTIYVKRNTADEFTVRVDVELNDGTPFKVNYSGPFAFTGADPVE